MFYRRDLSDTLLRFSKFPVIAILGPRQSGKTTIAKNTFKNHVFLSLEDPELLAMANDDPKGLLRRYENEFGIILDEFQNAPKILALIQVEADAKDRPGYFVLTGSQNFLMNEAIAQSLAGRVGILTLLTLSINELEENNILPKNVETLILNGQYPRIYKSNFEPTDLYPSYIHSYLERDIRQIINLTNLRSFQKFLILCAGRVGQLLNISEIACQCGISSPTAQNWLSALEASYIIYMLKPFWNNFNKRVIKTSKLYFYDTGLVCSLLGITTIKDLINSPFYGSLFECLIISDLYKQFFNIGTQVPLYFWRDTNKRNEIDCLIDKGGKLIPIEIKSSETYNPHFFNTIKEWSKISDTSLINSYVIYGGDLMFKDENGNLLNWKNMGKLVLQTKQLL